jgi:sigma-B regulation protein RsbU (phosphoserine phosphatase)
VTASASARTDWRPAALAAGAGLASFALGIAAESLIIRAVRGDRADLEWLSDAVISLGVAGITYLWLHLRSARLRVLALQQEQIVIDEQLRLAAEIQRGLLPDVPRTTPGYRWAARMVAASRIGGDFYDFFQPAKGVVLVMLADVSGKGIPASLVLSSLKALFRTFGRETVDPAAIAERVSAALYEEYAGLPYATAIVARFEAGPLALSYVNAGHPAACLARDGKVSGTLSSGGPPLGLLPGLTYEAASVELRPGDVGLLLTDGITEAFEAGPTTLGQAIEASLARSSDGKAPDAVCEELLRAAAAGPGPAGVRNWHDDRTVLVFAVEP